MTPASDAAPWSFVVHTRGCVDNGGTREWSFGVHVPEDLAAFRGHFVGDPIVPAVMLLSTLVLGLVAEIRPELPALRRVSKLKFRRPVRPGDELTVRIEWAGDSRRLSFKIDARGETAGQGTLEFGDHIDG